MRLGCHLESVNAWLRQYTVEDTRVVYGTYWSPLGCYAKCRCPSLITAAAKCTNCVLERLLMKTSRSTGRQAGINDGDAYLGMYCILVCAMHRLAGTYEVQVAIKDASGHF